jgi:hypothetical protein
MPLVEVEHRRGPKRIVPATKIPTTARHEIPLSRWLSFITSTSTSPAKATRVAVPLAAFLALATPVLAQRPSPSRVYHISRVHEPPRLEWFIAGADGTAVALGTPVTDFRQREPGDGTPVSQSTTAFLSYDDSKLYVVFVCKDDPASIRANVARRESIAADDGVAVYLDTFHDRQRAYVFMVNPLGVQLDGFQTEGQDEDLTFDTLWQSEGRLTSDGYVVRIAIPFRSLRFAPRGESWGIALGRFIRRSNEEAYWPYITKRVNSFVPQFGSLAGLHDISPGQNVQFIPYGVLARARVFDEDTPTFRTTGEQRIGLDAKLVFRDALTFDATVLPDFSQVESDDPQVTVNERFEVFFPEKRPFFIENAGYFQTPINLLFSRRIVDPGLGARLTGRVGRWSLGAIAMNDRNPEQVDAGDPLAGRSAFVGALRLQRQIGEQSTLGLLATDREFAGSVHRTYAVDSRLKLGSNWAVDAQIVRSEAIESDSPRAAGWGLFSSVDAEGRHTEYRARYVGFTPEFTAPLGFVRRVGLHEVEQELQYKWRPESRPVVSYGPTLELLYNWDRRGGLQDREVEAGFQVEFTRETELEITRTETFELFESTRFHPHSTEVSFSTEWLRWLEVGGSYVWGTDVNHDPAPGLEPFLADATEAGITVTLRPTPRLRVDDTFLVSRFTLDRARVFTERRLRTRVNYQFNRFLSLRAIVDYEAVVPNAALSDEDDERKWAADVLLTYLLNPGTALHLGYTDQHENVIVLPGLSREIRRTRSPQTSVGRQVFAKVSYLLRF